MPSLNVQDEGYREDTRRFARYPVEVPVRVELLQSRRKDGILYLKTYDLSASGAFFPEWKSMPVGRLINVEFYLFFEPQDTVQTSYDVVVTTVKGKVVRSNSFGTAVSFAEDYQMKSYRCLLSDIGGQKTDNLPAGLRGHLANIGYI